MRVTQGLFFHFRALRAHLVQVSLPSGTNSTYVHFYWWPLEGVSTPRRWILYSHLRVNEFSPRCWTSSFPFLKLPFLQFGLLHPFGIWPKRWCHQVSDAKAAPLSLTCPNISPRTSHITQTAFTSRIPSRLLLPWHNFLSIKNSSTTFFFYVLLLPSFSSFYTLIFITGLTLIQRGWLGV